MRPSTSSAFTAALPLEHAVERRFFRFGSARVRCSCETPAHHLMAGLCEVLAEPDPHDAGAATPTVRIPCQLLLESRVTSRPLLGRSSRHCGPAGFRFGHASARPCGRSSPRDLDHRDREILAAQSWVPLPKGSRLPPGASASVELVRIELSVWQEVRAAAGG